MGHSHEHLDSGNVEHYTPEYIINAARRVLGDIDLDPASSAIANLTVNASEYYTLLDNGLERPWYGRVWLNHPFGKASGSWIYRLAHDYEHRRVTEAVCITWANFGSEWLKPMLAYPMCIPYKRVHYYGPDGVTKSQAPKGSVIFYLGRNISAFRDAFNAIGQVYIPADIEIL